MRRKMLMGIRLQLASSVLVYFFSPPGLSQAAVPLDIAALKPVVACEGYATSPGKWFSSFDCLRLGMQSANDPGLLMLGQLKFDSDSAILYGQLKDRAVGRILEHLRFRQKIRGDGSPELYLGTEKECAAGHELSDGAAGGEASGADAPAFLDRYLLKGTCAITGSAKGCRPLSEMAYLSIFDTKATAEVRSARAWALTQLDPALARQSEAYPKMTVLDELAILEKERRDAGPQGDAGELLGKMKKI